MFTLLGQPLQIPAGLSICHHPTRLTQAQMPAKNFLLQDVSNGLDHWLSDLRGDCWRCHLALAHLVQMLLAIFPPLSPSLTKEEDPFLKTLKTTFPPSGWGCEWSCLPAEGWMKSVGLWLS